MPQVFAAPPLQAPECDALSTTPPSPACLQTSCEHETKWLLYHPTHLGDVCHGALSEKWLVTVVGYYEDLLRKLLETVRSKLGLLIPSSRSSLWKIPLEGNFESPEKNISTHHLSCCKQEVEGKKTKGTQFRI